MNADEGPLPRETPREPNGIQDIAQAHLVDAQAATPETPIHLIIEKYLDRSPRFPELHRIEDDEALGLLDQRGERQADRTAVEYLKALIQGRKPREAPCGVYAGALIGQQHVADSEDEDTGHGNAIGRGAARGLDRATSRSQCL